jgi:DNA-directed RNA polymerase subunit RPC12/RpoP
MIQRQCPECGSELVLSRGPGSQNGSGIVTTPRNYWRCSTCGRSFTPEQIRENIRAKPA